MSGVDWPAVVAQAGFTDAAHRRIARTLVALAGGEPRAAATGLPRLGGLFRRHFRAQDARMARIAFAEAEAHRREHALFLVQFDAMLGDLPGQHGRAGQILDFVAVWLVTHAMSADRRLEQAARRAEAQLTACELRSGSP